GFPPGREGEQEERPPEYIALIAGKMSQSPAFDWLLACIALHSPGDRGTIVAAITRPLSVPPTRKENCHAVTATRRFVQFRIPDADGASRRADLPVAGKRRV